MSPRPSVRLTLVDNGVVNADKGTGELYVAKPPDSSDGPTTQAWVTYDAEGPLLVASVPGPDGMQLIRRPVPESETVILPAGPGVVVRAERVR